MDRTVGDANRGAPNVPPIDVALVRRLIATQFPQWADLPIKFVEPSGWDNRTFRLGTDMSVRLPSGPGYAAQVDQEQRWLPKLAPHLPLPIPTPVARGAPAEGYPFDWSVYRWIDGETASVDRIHDLTEFAVTLAGFLTALQQVDPVGGPPPAPHNGFRGGPLHRYDAETRRAIEVLRGRIAGDAATAVWEAALESCWDAAPVWFHGDVTAGNLLTRNGRLVAVIDFGCSGVGDPACDVAIAWTLFSGASRRAFRSALAVDAGTWARGRGWALWKALITLVEHHNSASRRAEAQYVVEQVLDDYQREMQQRLAL